MYNLAFESPLLLLLAVLYSDKAFFIPVYYVCISIYVVKDTSELGLMDSQCGMIQEYFLISHWKNSLFVLNEYYKTKL